MKSVGCLIILMLACGAFMFATRDTAPASSAPYDPNGKQLILHFTRISANLVPTAILQGDQVLLKTSRYSLTASGDTLAQATTVLGPPLSSSPTAGTWKVQLKALWPDARPVTYSYLQIIFDSSGHATDLKGSVGQP